MHCLENNDELASVGGLVGATAIFKMVFIIRKFISKGTNRKVYSPSCPWISMPEVSPVHILEEIL